VFNVVSAGGWALVLVALAALPARTWSVLAPVQSLAALEVVHVLAGRVRSPLPTTLVQVASRLILVWAIVARFDATHASPVYTTMVVAWSLTEVPRYAYYALPRPPPWLTWLRYSTFYLLYPLGAGSEALLALSTISEWQHGWSLEDWLKAAMVVVWIPGLYVMYTHMIRTRRKVLGKALAKPQERATAH
jgi:very-long-chain (3R)-3-hydroxyacyl-CoA dehydratase